MTTREDLVRERDALVDLRSEMLAPSTWHAALTASIARVEALLSLSDVETELLADKLLTLTWGPGVDAYRTIAELVRRTS